MNIPTDIKTLAFASQKGGVGKSTISEIVSSILHYERGYNVLVIDLDMKQNSFYELRKRDRIALENDEGLSIQVIEYLNTVGKKSYPVLLADCSGFDEVISSGLEKYPETNLIIVDMPGRADDMRLIRLLSELDVILYPIEPDIQSLTSCLAYAKAVKTLRTDKPAYFFWNKVYKSAQTEKLVSFYNTVLEKNGLSVLKTIIPQSSKFSRELSLCYNGIFRSTLITPNKKMRRGMQIEEFVNEVINKVLI